MAGQVSFDFTGKRVLVTGGTRGIGRGAVEAFLTAGARVAVNGRTDQSTNAALATLSIEAVAAPGDVATAGGCRAVVAAAVAELGGLDVLVNCAGIATGGPVDGVSEETWDAIVDINLKGSFFCLQAALPHLRASLGNVVNLASDAGLIGEVGLSVYCASKGGVVNMTRALALELAPDIRVNAVCPGYVDTDMVRRDVIDAAANPAAAEAALKASAPLNRIATPEEIASAILYLASDAARFMTGAALQIDGGTTAGHPRQA
ncbi:SDR family NAD(P)-dependent oxidoreductase [Aestuariivirga sp.]|uniref:SDR family NAD(P)-dependent oxidoreductase n=1 Tax=Aestuariivirga sp. TaxID=2650926 RepID=UPI003BAA74EA